MNDDEGLDAVLGALANPVRRRLMERLLTDGPESASTLARDLPISRQAVTRHLVGLAEAGLVDTDPVGREVHYRAVPRTMTQAIQWMARVGSEWDRRLEDLHRVLADDTDNTDGP